jgi:hypothetical protein
MTDEQLVWMQVYAENSRANRLSARRFAEEAVEDFRARWPRTETLYKVYGRVGEAEPVLLAEVDADWRTLCEQNLVRRIAAWIRAEHGSVNEPEWMASAIEAEFLK